MPAITGYVGPATLSDGNSAPVRLGKTGDMIASLLHGRYYEQAKRGNLFYAHTALTGVAPGTAIGTTAAFTLYNPVGSGKDLVVLTGFMGYISGTLGAGVIDWVANFDLAAAAVSGTAIVPRNAYLTGAASVAAPKTTATLPASPTAWRIFGNLQASLASTAVGPWQLVDQVDGAIIVPPGCAISLEGTAAAGTSPLVAFGSLWEEVAI